MKEKKGWNELNTKVKEPSVFWIMAKVGYCEKQRAFIGYSCTFEQPGVKAPGTPKIIIFLPAANEDMLTFSAGDASNRSTLGSLSPTCN